MAQSVSLNSKLFFQTFGVPCIPLTLPTTILAAVMCGNGQVFRGGGLDRVERRGDGECRMSNRTGLNGGRLAGYQNSPVGEGRGRMWVSRKGGEEHWWAG